MTSNNQNRQDEDSETEGVHGAEPLPELDKERVSIDIARSRDWMPAEELRETALTAIEANQDITLNLEGLEYLDASSLQILLAFDKEQKKRGRHLNLANISPNLRQWFEYSGAAEFLSGWAKGR